LECRQSCRPPQNKADSPVVALASVLSRSYGTALASSYRRGVDFGEGICVAAEVRRYLGVYARVFWSKEFSLIGDDVQVAVRGDEQVLPGTL
jgi:hypothetical protein